MLLVHMALEHGDLEARIAARTCSSKFKKVRIENCVLNSYIQLVVVVHGRDADLNSVLQCSGSGQIHNYLVSRIRTRILPFFNPN